MIIYNDRLEAIEMVYTYEEWLKEYNCRKTKQRIRQRTEHLYYIKQKILGVIMVSVGIMILFLFSEDITVSLFVLPLGIFLLLTKEKIVTF